MNMGRRSHKALPGGFLVALLLGAMLWVGGAAAQVPPTAWNTAPGQAADLAIAGSGEIFAAGVRGDLWLWRDENSSWVPVPGSAVRIAAGPAGQLWGVRADGTLVRYDGVRWERLPVKAKDVAVDAQGNAVIARADGGLARWNPERRDFDPIPGSGHRVAVNADGSIWVVAEDGSISINDGQKSEPLPGKARDIAAGGNAVLIAAADGTLQRWNEGTKSWDPEPGGAEDVAIVAVSPNGTPWTANSRGAIRTPAPMKFLLSGGTSLLDSQKPPEGGITFSKRRGQGGGFGRSAAGRSAGARASAAAAAVVLQKPPAQTTDPNPFEFVDTLGTASRLAIGQDGSVFALATDGSLGRWSNSRRSFVAFPGSLVRIAVDPAGSPWGINQSGRIFRHTGTDWRQVRGTASDIAIAANGTVMIASSTGVVSRYDPPTDGFLQVPGLELFFLALTADGTPWGLSKDGTVLRCPANPCEQVGRDAKQISIGPDGSVFIMTFANELRRFNAASGLFEFIPVPGHTAVYVATGPFGRPWVVTSAGKVLSSRFFERDESVDLQTASSSTTPTTGSGDTAAIVTTTTAPGTGFTFNKNMQFNGFSVSPPCSGPVDDLYVGVDGTVIVECDMQSRLLLFNASSKTFSDILNLPSSAICSVDVDSEGRIWIADLISNGTIYRQRQKNSTTYDTIQVPNTTLGPGSPFTLAITPDDTAYYIDRTGTLYRKTKIQANFSKFINGSFVRVAIGGTGDIWVIAGDGILYQLVNGKLERRPASGTPTFFDLGGGPDGSIYVTAVFPGDGSPTLYKWNASNQSFDRVNRTAIAVDVAPNGRPWIFDFTTPTQVFQAK